MNYNKIVFISGYVLAHSARTRVPFAKQTKHVDVTQDEFNDRYDQILDHTDTAYLPCPIS